MEIKSGFEGILGLVLFGSIGVFFAFKSVGEQFGSLWFILTVKKEHSGLYCAWVFCELKKNGVFLVGIFGKERKRYKVVWLDVRSSLAFCC